MTIINNNIYTVPDVKADPTRITLTGRDRNNSPRNYVLSDRSVAFIGCPGCGKTTTILKVIDQINKNPKAVTVILDIKKEYIYKCFEPGDVVLSLNDIPGIPTQSQAKWSLMKEAYFDTNPEAVLREIAKMVFKDAIESSENKAFPKAAMLVFYGQLVHYLRSRDAKLPSVGELIHNIESISDSEIINNVKKYADLFAMKDLLSETPNITSFGVRMELKTVLLDTFPQGTNFCSEDDSFSIRQFMHEGYGHKLFLVFDIENRKSSEAIIRLLLDLALKESLVGDNLKDDDMTRYNFILDEYGYLPSGLEYLDLAKDIGRSKHARIYSGFQTFSQLKKLYGGKEENAVNDISGYGDIVVFTPHDQTTRDLVRSRSGTEITSYTSIDAMCNIHTETREIPVVPQNVLNELKAGEAVILPNEGRPFWFVFDNKEN